MTEPAGFPHAPHHFHAAVTEPAGLGQAFGRTFEHQLSLVISNAGILKHKCGKGWAKDSNCLASTACLGLCYPLRESAS